MKDKTYLIISGIVFGLWTIGLLARLLYQIPVQVGTLNVPIWPSFIGTVLALLLCIWAFWLVRTGRQQKRHFGAIATRGRMARMPL